MDRRWVGWVVLLASCAEVGCSSGSKATDAAVATAVTVAAVGANRALTRECWAACTPGYVCDQKRGLCVPGECVPACVEPDQCTLVGTKRQCVPARRSVVHSVWPVFSGQAQYTPTADADLANRNASVPLGTQANPPATIAGKSEASHTLIHRRASCAAPGSDAWYAEASLAAGTVVGDRHRDLVGVWSSEENPLGASTAVAVTPRYVEQQGARSYEVLEVGENDLLLRAYPPLPFVSAAEFVVAFVDKHRIDFGGMRLKRYDCRREGPHAELCCSLPRARWVILGPE